MESIEEILDILGEAEQEACDQAMEEAAKIKALGIDWLR